MIDMPTSYELLTGIPLYGHLQQSNMETKYSLKILILGGTEFMGKALLDELDPHDDSVLICCVNRGKLHWNNEARKQHPNVKFFIADRKDHRDTSAMVNFIGDLYDISPNNKWDSVIDFCGFRWRDIQSVIKGIDGKANNYIFISTDSVYNNMETTPQGPITQAEFDVVKECNRVRQNKEKSVDMYGYNKLKCELYLKRRCPVPFICLRLPDVLGKYENTQRFWSTMGWITHSKRHPIPMTPRDRQKQISLVDSQSVAKFIAKIVPLTHFQDNFLNLTSRETPTLIDFIKMIAQEMKENVNFAFEQEEKYSTSFYPSVDFGPISSSLAQEKYGWNPKPLEQVVRQTVKFFAQKGIEYRQEKADMEKELKKKLSSLALKI